MPRWRAAPSTLALSVTILIASELGAQACIGTQSVSRPHVRIGASTERVGRSAGYAASLGVSASSLFGNISVGTHAVDGYTGRTHSLTATVGRQQARPAKRVQLCQMLVVSYGSGSGTHTEPLLGSGMFGNGGGPFKLLRATATAPAILQPEGRTGATSTDHSSWGLMAGVAVGRELRKREVVMVVPAASLALAHHRGELAAPDGIAPRMQTYGLLSATVGLVFNDIAAVRPTVALPLGVSGVQPIFGLGVILAPGTR